jgi:phosphatidylinositol alpha 1,6-mannosyltransferase
VATVSRQFVTHSLRRKIPFFCAHSGPQTQLTHGEHLTTLELSRGFASFCLDHDLFCDPLLSRYKTRVLEALQPFQPDLIQITGPGDMGIMGLWMAHLLQVPLVASWHTNLHEYAARRLDQNLSFLPGSWRQKFSELVEQQCLRACMWFYNYGRFTMAPNPAMVDVLRERTGRPSFLMPHGVDTEVYTPRRRTRRHGPFRVGYVGRLTPEKNVRLIAELEQALIAAGQRNFRMVIVGEGSERDWLRRHLQFAELRGVLRGEALAETYAGMDAFVFPSGTDTFGLVLLEAMASGVPVVVRPETAARVGIRDGVTGFHARDLNGFTHSVIRLMEDETLQQDMGLAARAFSCSQSWDGVFNQMYRTYETGLEMIGRAKSRLEEVSVV